MSTKEVDKDTSHDDVADSDLDLSNPLMDCFPLPDGELDRIQAEVDAELPAVLQQGDEVRVDQIRRLKLARTISYRYITRLSKGLSSLDSKSSDELDQIMQKARQAYEKLSKVARELEKIEIQSESSRKKCDGYMQCLSNAIRDLGTKILCAKMGPRISVANLAKDQQDGVVPPDPVLNVPAASADSGKPTGTGFSFGLFGGAKAKVKLVPDPSTPVGPGPQARTGGRQPDWVPPHMDDATKAGFEKWFEYCYRNWGPGHPEWAQFFGSDQRPSGQAASDAFGMPFAGAPPPGPQNPPGGWSRSAYTGPPPTFHSPPPSRPPPPTFQSSPSSGPGGRFRSSAHDPADAGDAHAAPAGGLPPNPAVVPNYKGIKRLEAKIFKGDEFDYPFWKSQFKAAYEGRGIPLREMALHLISYLDGPPRKLVRTLITDVSDETYASIWTALDRRYGGEYREDQVITDQFEKARTLDSYRLKDLEHFVDILSGQLAYYRRVDIAALANSKSLLMKLARRKLGPIQAYDFLKFVEDRGLTETFPTLVLFVESKLRAAQRVEKEFHSASGSGRVQKAVVHYGDESVESGESEAEVESEAEAESESESQEVYQVVKAVAKGSEKAESWQS